MPWGRARECRCALRFRVRLLCQLRTGTVAIEKADKRKINLGDLVHFLLLAI